MSGLYTPHRKVPITPEEKFQNQQMLIQSIKNTQVKNQQRNYWAMNLKKIFISKQKNIFVCNDVGQTTTRQIARQEQQTYN